MKESDIVYEIGAFWVAREQASGRYVVFENGLCFATSDSAYPLTTDGLSIAKARADYLAKRKQGR